MPRLTLPRGARVTRHTEVRRVLDFGRSAASGGVVVYAFFRGDSLPPRMCLVVSVRWGDAVRRNRVRRLLRESFRTTRANLALGFDYALVPKAPLGGRKMAEVKDALTRAALAATKRFQVEGPGRPRAERSQ